MFFYHKEKMSSFILRNFFWNECIFVVLNPTFSCFLLVNHLINILILGHFRIHLEELFFSFSKYPRLNLLHFAILTSSVQDGQEKILQESEDRQCLGCKNRLDGWKKELFAHLSGGDFSRMSQYSTNSESSSPEAHFVFFSVNSASCWNLGF